MMFPPPLSSCVFAIKMSAGRSNYSIVCANYTLTVGCSVSWFSSTSHLSGSQRQRMLSRTPLQGSLQQSPAVSNDHRISHCASRMVRYLVLNKYSVHLCGLMADSYFPVVAVDLLSLCLMAGGRAGSPSPLRHIEL